MSEEPTLIEKLKDISRLKPGDDWPEWMVGSSNWGIPLAEICRQAAEKLERYEHLENMINNYPKGDNQHDGL